MAFFMGKNFERLNNPSLFLSPLLHGYSSANSNGFHLFLEMESLHMDGIQFNRQMEMVLPQTNQPTIIS